MAFLSVFSVIWQADVKFLSLWWHAMYISWIMSSAFNGEALKKECPYCSGGFPKIPKLASTIMNTMKVMFDARTNPQSYYKEISVMNFMISLELSTIKQLKLALCKRQWHWVYVCIIHPWTQILNYYPYLIWNSTGVGFWYPIMTWLSFKYSGIHNPNSTLCTKSIKNNKFLITPYPASVVGCMSLICCRISVTWFVIVSLQRCSLSCVRLLRLFLAALWRMQWSLSLLQWFPKDACLNVMCIINAATIAYGLDK